jgi:UDP-glucuronate decarboxylase
VFKPLPQDDPRQRRPDITRARRHLNWDPQVGLHEGLGATAADFKARLFGGAGDAPTRRTEKTGKKDK